MAAGLSSNGPILSGRAKASVRTGRSTPNRIGAGRVAPVSAPPWLSARSAPAAVVPMVCRRSGSKGKSGRLETELLRGGVVEHGDRTSVPEQQHARFLAVDSYLHSAVGRHDERRHRLCRCGLCRHRDWRENGRNKNGAKKATFSPHQGRLRISNSPVTNRPAVLVWINGGSKLSASANAKTRSRS